MTKIPFDFALHPYVSALFSCVPQYFIPHPSLTLLLIPTYLHHGVSDDRTDACVHLVGVCAEWIPLDPTCNPVPAPGDIISVISNDGMVSDMHTRMEDNLTPI